VERYWRDDRLHWACWCVILGSVSGRRVRLGGDVEKKLDAQLRWQRPQLLWRSWRRRRGVRPGDWVWSRRQTAYGVSMGKNEASKDQTHSFAAGLVGLHAVSRLDYICLKTYWAWTAM
jgi:hypothetical protein